ncbi:phage tail tube protein [Ralstonia mannitolilytica]|uniref:phage tail tube protein n=1 Tax=Ralstonia mannitolilytica TaxID=105219 RepID=UPI0028F67BB9|nr:hypothetical protein [Ralstonia mannitolilytica]CAJ0743770.1 hypothetical protein R76696_04649 [Ralstonia mannitolilytica]
MDMQPYYYGQGKVYAGMRVNGVVKAMKWLLDVSNLDAEFQVEQKKHKESWSGQAATVVKLIAGKSASVTMTVMQRSADNLALVLHGTATKGVAGTVTGEQLPTGLAAGDRITLAHPSVTNLVLTDSAATPAPVDPSKYTLDPIYGAIEIKDVAGSTQPWKAAYSYGTAESVSIFTAPQPEFFLRYEGINLADGGNPVIAEFYRVSTDPLKKLSMIDSGDIAGMEVTGEIMLDPTRPASAEFGQFGRLVQLPAAA